MNAFIRSQLLPIKNVRQTVIDRAVIVWLLWCALFIALMQ